MDEENFRVLIQILRIIEQEELRGNRIKDVISSMLDTFYPEMTDEQKKKMNDEFSFYIKKRF